MNYVELIELHAERVFADKVKAKAWLNTPQTVWGGITPLQFARSESGYASVKDALERINHGFFL
ncbi:MULTISPECIES: MbcA/ParS/Xre antitoxin family protein [unclassified Pseudomonas]|uniref:MbcA/ParS/Xre antitoxin family protein n=1 Tax=unclassified Pseudomonas TaxID=196821 RepID=UPI001B3416E4|nr:MULTISPECIES: MbcA/ParS/Xre antitoxin family protein [unclassified Pseudomonas]